jgi:AraC-like DNA-binding protein
MESVTALFQPFPMLPGRRAQAWRHQPQFRRPRHFHDEPELNLVARGSGVLGVGERNVTVSTGQLLYFQPGQDHVLLEASDDFDLLVFALRPELAERALGARGVCSTQCFEVTGVEVSVLADELSALGEVRDGFTTDERLARLFAMLTERAPKVHVRSRRALENLRSEQSLSEGALARRLRTDPSCISRRFHHDLGMTLVEYRARLRLMRFVALVDDGATLIRAALEAGFGSYAQCHRVFARSLGCSPRDYFGGLRVALDDART